MEKVLDSILSTGEYHVTIDHCVHAKLCYNPIQQSSNRDKEREVRQEAQWDMETVDTFLLKLSYSGDTYQSFTRVSDTEIEEQGCLKFHYNCFWQRYT